MAYQSDLTSGLTNDGRYNDADFEGMKRNTEHADKIGQDNKGTRIPPVPQNQTSYWNLLNTKEGEDQVERAKKAASGELAKDKCCCKSITLSVQCDATYEQAEVDNFGRSHGFHRGPTEPWDEYLKRIRDKMNEHIDCCKIKGTC